MAKSKNDYVTVTVHVTEKHIRKGQKVDWENCPIAIALKDRGLKNVKVFFGNTYAAFSSGNVLAEMTATTTQGARKFILAFDKGGRSGPRVKLKPATFRFKFRPQ